VINKFPIPAIENNCSTITAPDSKAGNNKNKNVDDEYSAIFQNIFINDCTIIHSHHLRRKNIVFSIFFFERNDTTSM